MKSYKKQDINSLMSIEEIAREIIATLERGNKILICGNGGSGSEADHFSGELVCKYQRNRKSLNAISLSANNCIITAIANDYGYEKIFSRQIEGIGKKRDLLITLSTSGASKNIKEAIIQAKRQGIKVIAFPTNNEIGTDTGATQVSHLQMIHEISRLVENFYS